jgi:hypothetical protein
MGRRRRWQAWAVAGLLVGFGAGVWFGSERTVRRVRHLSDPRNRKWLVEQAKQRRWRGRKGHPLRDLLR